jgi:hypothetical protein
MSDDELDEVMKRHLDDELAPQLERPLPAFEPQGWRLGWWWPAAGVAAAAGLVIGLIGWPTGGEAVVVNDPEPAARQWQLLPATSVRQALDGPIVNVEGRPMRLVLEAGYDHVAATDQEGVELQVTRPAMNWVLVDEPVY